MISLGFVPDPNSDIFLMCACGETVDYRKVTGRIVIGRDLKLYFGGCPHCDGTPLGQRITLLEESTPKQGCNCGGPLGHLPGGIMCRR